MRYAWVSRVRIVMIVSTIVLSAAFVFMNESVGAAPPSTIANTNSTTSWDKNLSGDSRFTVLSPFGGAAVRDNNTGLVWEQSPSGGGTTRMWEQAINDCVNKTVGGTAGWRLPSVVELKSIQDPSLPAPFVPTTVFTGVQSATQYWSASTHADFPAMAWYVDFGSGNASYQSKANGPLVWCVRGSMNADRY